MKICIVTWACRNEVEKPLRREVERQCCSVFNSWITSSVFIIKMKLPNNITDEMPPIKAMVPVLNQQCQCVAYNTLRSKNEVKSFISAVNRVSAVERNHLTHGQTQEQDLCFCSHWNGDCQSIRRSQENCAFKDQGDVREV